MSNLVVHSCPEMYSGDEGDLRHWFYYETDEDRLAEHERMAKLYTAAPDMLNALKAVRRYVEALEKFLDPTIDPGAPTIREHCAMLRAAIRKAEGETP